MNMFSARKSDPTPAAAPTPTPLPVRSNGAHSSAASGGLLSRGVSIKGTVKFRDKLLIDGEVEGTIDSTGTLTVGEHASIKGEIKTKSIKVRGTVHGDIVATERCELQAGCTLQGDIEAPRLIVDENATFCGSAKVASQG
ncbi:MAG TPA: polymer-forming cytoskeletal protein [Chthoniobacterales bacterium]|jgi:cytoskeletal protein CcmA (bactofilin family)|nr:polymer-forming cytoskeletal protein [Chthoniobacterales bacterium]